MTANREILRRRLSLPATVQIETVDSISGLYVTDAGEIYRQRGNLLYRLTPYWMNGYLNVSVHQANHETRLRIHRLVAELFVPWTDGAYWVRHINGDRADNRAENLVWTHRKQLPLTKAG